MGWKKNAWRNAGLTACGLSACVAQESEETARPDIEMVTQALDSADPALGMYHWDAPNGPLLIDAAATWLGRNFDVALTYTGRDHWADVTGPDWQLSAWSRWINARPGRKLVCALSMLPGPANGAGPDGSLGTSDDVSLQKCSDGAYDSYWRALANNLVSYGLGQTILRVGWEFNGDWFPWAASGREAQFAGCFRQVVTVMRQAQPNAGFKFDWNPTEDIAQWSSSQIHAAWPGDAYVDYIGVDAYDTSWAANTYPYPANCDASCRLTRQTNAWNDMSQGLYAMRDMATAHGKLLSIPEWGVWTRDDGHGGGEDPFYIGKMYDFIRAPESRVGYQIYFDVNWVDGSHQLSDVDGDGNGTTALRTFTTTFPDSAARFRALFAQSSTPSTPTPPASAPPAPVRVTNPGFEAGQIGWHLYGSAATMLPGPHSGRLVLHLGSARGGAEQDLISQLQVGSSYKVS
ncbi:MAG TPA: glycosyl hydrolase, partial [Polyangiaceae bacterium]|nr:glycosyl hydrolase [Polyangiaceae bacterium]